MVNASDTLYLLEMIFDKCFEYWIDEVDGNDRMAFELALDDLSSIDTNPFVENGDKLDKSTKEEFIKNMESELED